jgi:hypothetical protein
MSSSSAYEPDEDDTELDSDSAPRRARQQRSTSRGRILKRLSVDTDTEAENPETEKLRKIQQDRLDALNNLFRDIHPNSLEAYTGLLAEVGKGSDPRNVKEDDQLLNVSQDGGVVWTATEKEILYNFLDRKSANGIKEIAAAIGTKSELEVMEHLRVVQKAMRKRLEQRRLRWITVAEIPAAAEIDQGCCVEQEKYANYLTLKDVITEEHANQLHYGDYGKISEVEAQALSNADLDTPLQGDIQLAAGLFNTPNWISLSKDFCMNFGGEREEDDWRNLIESEEEMPSITADALMDFSALATSLTRRLIQSSIFMAESRLRTTGVISEDHCEIKLGDVRTAIEVLNLKRKRPSFLELARRNRIVIGAFPPQRTIATRTIGYGDAMRVLGYSDKKFYKAAHAMEQEKVSHNDVGETAFNNRDDSEDEVIGKDSDDSEEYYDEEDIEDEAVLDTQNESSLPNTSQNPEHQQPGISDGQLAEDKEEEEADNFDREQSRREELRLWSMFEKAPPPALLIPIAECIPNLNEERKEAMDDEKDDLAQHGISEHRGQEDVVDWRDHTLYRSEWEQYGSDLEDLAEELVQNTRKRRRVEAGDAENDEEDDHARYDGGEKGENEEQQGEIAGEGPDQPPGEFKSAAIVESEDDSDDEASDGSSSGRGSPVDSSSSDDSGDQERGNQVTASAPTPPPAIYVDSDNDDNNEVRNQENEAGNEKSTGSGSGSGSDSDSSDSSSSDDGPGSGNRELGATIEIPSDSDSDSDSDSSGSPSSDDGPGSGNQERGATIEISSDSDSDSDSNADSSDNSSSEDSPPGPLPAATHSDPMDLDDDPPAALPPTGFM